VPVSHAGAAVSSLLVMLADITHPRDPRGVRHPLVAVLGSPPNPATSPKNAGTAGPAAGPPGPPAPTPRPGRAPACRTPPAWRSSAATSPTWPDSRSARRSCSWPPAAPTGLGHARADRGLPCLVLGHRSPRAALRSHAPAAPSHPMPVRFRESQTLVLVVPRRGADAGLGSRRAVTRCTNPARHSYRARERRAPGKARSTQR